MKYAAYIRYVGTDFCGYQTQPDKRTVQGELNKAALAVFGVPCAITGCSRTDSGVHAEMFCLTIEPQEGGNRIPANKLPLAFAPFLPWDISLYYAVEVEDCFHARYSVIKKEYVYRLVYSPVENPFQKNRVWTIRRHLRDGELERMQQACAHFVGEHDFVSFMSAGGQVRSTVRTVYSAEMECEGNALVFRITGNGFLYNMVRIIVGTLVDCGSGIMDPADIPLVLAGKARLRAGQTAPPDGLYLNRVWYEKPF